MVKRILVICLCTLFVPVIASTQPKQYPKAKVSFEDFKSIVSAVEPQRATRLIDFDTFLSMSKDPNTIILDSRSDFRFDRIHLKGAKHLSFTDFTQANLAKVIPSFETRILIYCNNNFEGNETDFATKMFVPLVGARITKQLEAQEKPKMMALNIPTFINLFGYGYRNVYELDELVDVKDKRAVFEGTIVKGDEYPQF